MFVVRNRQANNVKVIYAYIELAVKSWKHPGIDVKNGERHGVKNLLEHIARIEASDYENCSVDEKLTPFITYSPSDSLSISEIRESFGFLDSKTIQKLAKFILAEEFTHAIANDFRSEYVRKQFTQKRKVDLLKSFDGAVIGAYDAGLGAMKKMKPYVNCRIFWWLVPCGLTYQVNRYRRQMKLTRGKREHC